METAEQLKARQERAEDLKLYAENDREIYFGYFLPIARNLSNHYKRGQFDYHKAATAFERYWATPAAKRYHLQCGDLGTRWFQQFDKPTRHQTGLLMASYVLREFELGNFWEAAA